jgi:hypothetical protein
MSPLSEFRSFNREQRAALVASFPGWTLDAFDFFVLVSVVKAIADDFHTEVKAVSFAILVTLAIPLWAFSAQPALLAAGAFVMQFVVPLQAQIASSHGGNYGLALALVAGSVAIVPAILASRGTEGRGKALHASQPIASSRWGAAS